MRYIILDLDGCIADDRRRLSLIDHTLPDPWLYYHQDAINDPLVNTPIAYLGWVYRPIIFTARPEQYRATTQHWLRKTASLSPAHLYMRPQGCQLLSPALKNQFLDQVLTDLGITINHIFLAVDDRTDVLAIYKQRGLTTMHVTIPHHHNHLCEPQ